VTLTISSGAIAAVSSNSATLGTSSITFTGVTSTSVGTIYLQGLSLGGTQLTAQAAGYNDATLPVQIDPSGFVILSPTSLNTSVFASPTNVSLRSSLLNPVTLNRAQDQSVRGGLTVPVTISNSNPATGSLTVNPVSFASNTFSAITQFAPQNGGTSNLSLSTPAGFSTPSNLQSIPVTVTGGVPAGTNLSVLPGVVATASSSFSAAYTPDRAIDGLSATNSSWCTANNDPAPVLSVAFPGTATVQSVVIVSPWGTTYDFLTGSFVFYDASDAQIGTTGNLTFTGGDISYVLPTAIANVARVEFVAATWNGIEPCLGEFAIGGF
jgi:hypothetical protein